MLDWLDGHVSLKEIKIIDFGCGNGHLLCSLGRRGFTNLTGMDYSAGAVELASKLAKSFDMQIEFYVDDALNIGNPKLLENLYDIIIDKGTFDAISLGTSSTFSKDSQDLRIIGIAKEFKNSLRALLKTNGFFVITSCNWIRSELEILFSPEFEFYDHVSHPSFSFGGIIGQTVTTLILVNKIIY